MPNPFKLADFIGGRNGNQVVSELLEWQNQVFNRIFQLKPNLSPTLRQGGYVPLYHLPIQEQITQMGKYRDIIGLNDVLLNLANVRAPGEIPTQLVDQLGESRARSVFNITSGLREFLGLDAKMPYYKFDVSYKPGGDPLDAIYSGMNLNFDYRVRDTRAGVMKAAESANVALHFGPGVNRIRTISPAYLNMPRTLREGATFTSFDIETAGLMSGQIREVAYRTGIAGAGGIPSGGETRNLIFDPLAVRRGTVGQALPEGKFGAVPLGEFLRQGKDVSDDFARSMVPFLESIKTSDYIIGHNISGFDIPQIIDQLVETAAYKSRSQSIIPGFRNLVDTAFANIDEKVVDTLTLATRARNLVGISVADELKQIEKVTPYSIANLLLQTDLIKRMSVSNPQIAGLIQSKGLHNAEVDDAVTRAIFQHLESLETRPLTDVGLRSAIMSSAAITPFTNAAVHTDISDRALKHLIASVDGGMHIPDISPANRRLAALVQDAQSGRALSSQSAERAFQLIRSGAASGISYKIKPIEQQIFETRRLGIGTELPTDFDATSYIFRTNLYDKLAYEDVGRRKSYENLIYGQRSDIAEDEFAAFQKSMSASKMPFAGLSREERRFGTALSHLTSSVDPRPAIRDISNLTSDTMVSTFRMFNPADLQYVSRSGRVSMPAMLLKDAGYLKEGTLLRMSVVDQTAYGGENAVNLIHQFTDQAQTEDFITRLKTLSRSSDEHLASALGLDPTTIATADPQLAEITSKFRAAINQGDVLESIRKNMAVAVGQLYGEEASPVIRAMQQFHGAQFLRDTSMIPMSLPFMNVVPGTTMGEGVVQTAGAVLDRGLTQADISSIGKHVENAKQIFEGFRSLALDPKNRHALGAANMAADMTNAGSDMIKTAFEKYQRIRPGIPKIVGAAALGLIALHMYGKHQENEPYSETFSPMPTVDNTRYSVADLLQARMASGINLYSQKYDPLSTAYVVDNLNSNKIGHTNMAWTRDNMIYGGVL